MATSLVVQQDSPINRPNPPHGMGWDRKMTRLISYKKMYETFLTLPDALNELCLFEEQIPHSFFTETKTHQCSLKLSKSQGGNC